MNLDLSVLLIGRGLPHRVQMLKLPEGRPFQWRMDVFLEAASIDDIRALIAWADDGESRHVEYSASTGFRLWEFLSEETPEGRE